MQDEIKRLRQRISHLRAHIQQEQAELDRACDRLALLSNKPFKLTRIEHGQENEVWHRTEHGLREDLPRWLRRLIEWEGDVVVPSVEEVIEHVKREGTGQIIDKDGIELVIRYIGGES
jgi:hypothetical protein